MKKREPDTERVVRIACALLIVLPFGFPLPPSPFRLPFSAFILPLWLFALGAVIGSFLNVVVYRLPLGKSLVYPGSHCPICNHPIRWYDNVPVLGWLLLGGRCRDCHSPISVRYPIVEAITGAIFALLGVAELIVPSSGLPLAEAVGAFYAAGGIYLYHLVLLCTLLVAALIERDGQRVPWRLVIFAAAVGVLAPLVWPGLRPDHGKLAIGLDMLVGIAAGAVVGWIAGRIEQSRPGGTGGATAPDRAALVIPLLVGLFLGWAVLVLAVITTALHLATAFCARCFTRKRLRFGWCAWWVVTTLVWIVLTR